MRRGRGGGDGARTVTAVQRRRLSSPCCEARGSSLQAATVLNMAGEASATHSSSAV